MSATEDFLAQLRRVNAERYHAWVGDGQDAGILFDAAELGGEVGELLNVVKKLVREEAGWRGSRAAPEDFADECGDVLICLDKLARRHGVDLAEATARKFNATSEKQGFPHKLALSPTHTVSDMGVDELARRKVVNTILAWHYNAFMPDIVDAIRVGNAACTDILAALTAEKPDTQGPKNAQRGLECGEA